jgi:hypothetical protein
MTGGRGAAAAAPAADLADRNAATSRVLGLLLVAVLALAALGVGLTARLLLQPAHAAGPEGVHTAVGLLSAGPLSVSAEHDPKDMIGMPPGAHGSHEGLRSQVAVTLTNTTANAISYSTAEFALETAEGTAAADGELSGARQTLRPGAAITLRLAFTTPSVQRPRLHWSPSVGSPVVVPLADQDPASQHSHSHEGTPTTEDH